MCIYFFLSFTHKVLRIFYYYKIILTSIYIQNILKKKNINIADVY